MITDIRSVRRASAMVVATVGLILSACGTDEGAADTKPAPSSAPTSVTVADTLPSATPLELPTKRSDIVPTAGDLPNGVYRFTQDVATLQASDPTGSFSAADESIMEVVLKDGTSEVRYFDIGGAPMQGEPPDTGGVYEVHGDQMIYATPPERSMPGTNGIYVLRWSFDGETLTLEQIDGRKLDADFMAPWLRVGDAP